MTPELTHEDLFDDKEVETDQYLVFTVAGQEFAFQAIRVQEITPVLPITPFPNAPSYVQGIMNLRGRLASALDFRRKFGYPQKPHDEETRIVIVEYGDFPIGVIVDSVEEVVQIPDTVVRRMPDPLRSAALEDYIHGIGLRDDRLIILLDVDRVLTKNELVTLGAIPQMVAQTKALLTDAEPAPEKTGARVQP